MADKWNGWDKCDMWVGGVCVRNAGLVHIFKTPEEALVDKAHNMHTPPMTDEELDIKPEGQK